MAISLADVCVLLLVSLSPLRCLRALASTACRFFSCLVWGAGSGMSAIWAAWRACFRCRAWWFRSPLLLVSVVPHSSHCSTIGGGGVGERRPSCGAAGQLCRVGRAPMFVLHREHRFLYVTSSRRWSCIKCLFKDRTMMHQSTALYVRVQDSIGHIRQSGRGKFIVSMPSASIFGCSLIVVQC